MQKVIALDGPAGSGKSTVAKEVAKRLNIIYIDTGALYRALGWYCDKLQIPFEEGLKLNQALKQVQLVYGKSADCLVEINGEDVSKIIREHRVSELASRISKINSVRTFLLEVQRDLGKNHLCIMEGRDIGTVIFPQAFCKIFMTANDVTRAKRRQKELEQKGETVDLQLLLTDMKQRDQRDSQRDVAPLKQADDALLLDTSDLSFDQVVNKVIELAKIQGSKVNLSL